MAMNRSRKTAVVKAPVPAAKTALGPPKRIAPPKAAPAPEPAVQEAPVKRGPGRPRKENGHPAGVNPQAAPVPTKAGSVPVTADTVRELMAKLAASEERVAKLSETVSRIRSKPRNVRTISDILDGAPPLPAKDWRADYLGVMANLKECGFDKPGDASTFAWDDDAEPVRGLLALPRDNDLGGEGTHARNSGWIAFHYNMTEDGEGFAGQPLYLQQDNLADVWIDGEPLER